jgi:RimJ/RimL family protein N-acetyltransferase
MGGTAPRLLWTISASVDDVTCALGTDCNGVELFIEQGTTLLAREFFPDRSTAYDRARVLRAEHDAQVSRQLNEIVLEAPSCVLRPWRSSDAAALAEHANSKDIGHNLRDGFPFPYGYEDALRFIAHAVALEPLCRFAIVVQGEAVGSIGFVLHPNVERVSAEIGYWLGERFRGRGLMTEAVRAITRYAITAHGLTRVFAVPYEWNPASFRVLEKAGFTCEGRMRRSAIKDGRVIDQLLYAYVVSEAGHADAVLGERETSG